MNYLLAIFLSLIFSSCNIFMGDTKVPAGFYYQTTPDNSSTIGNGGMTCPTGYIVVPANSALGISSDFCVMQYEAKNDGSGNAVSVAAGTPWVTINQTDAKSECSSLGANYDLISNPEWMAIARSIESVSNNWSGASVGSGHLSRGWSAGAPDGDAFSNTGPAPSTDSSCLFNTGADTCSVTGSHIFKRTLSLSNGVEIWDFASHVREWVDWTFGGVLDVGPTSCSAAETELPSVACGALAGNDYDSTTGTYTSTEAVGKLYGGSGGAAMRGGTWGEGSRAGIYRLNLSPPSSTTSADIGFRCVYRP